MNAAHISLWNRLVIQRYIDDLPQGMTEEDIEHDLTRVYDLYAALDPDVTVEDFVISGAKRYHRYHENGTTRGGVMEFDYTLAEIDAMPTIREGWTAHLKYEDGNNRVWLERVGKEDGLPYNNMVVVEHFDGNRWVELRHYKAK